LAGLQRDNHTKVLDVVAYKNLYILRKGVMREMKRKLISVAAIAILVILSLTPVQVSAATKTPTNFTASGFIAVTSMPAPTINGHLWQYKGEVVAGSITQSDWVLLNQAAFSSVHDSWVMVYPPGAPVTLAGPITLEGAYSSVIGQPRSRD
jgi:hypothetical protein